jgi:alginate O-acetyltransferase complex protein AlgI
MTFTSLTFLIFFTVVFGLYWIAPQRRVQNYILLGASYLFYGWWDWRFCGLIFFSSFVDYVCALKVDSSSSRRGTRLWLISSLVINLGLLGYFKYANFFLDSFYQVFGHFGFSDSGLLKVVLPVGISFYTFQTISYTIDVYRGKLKATRSLVDYLVYVSFFPQLVAGPIERGAHLLPQFLKPRVFDPSLAADGMRQILWGCVQKMVIADNLGSRIVNPVYADLAASSGPLVMIATICFAFQIYCDFAAYSNIAIGASKLLGFDLMKNFAYPYFSQSVDEFWRRWHISLSTWFRDYLYIPLGGSRCSSTRYCVNVLITFGVSGLWHGASWTFVIWGLLNGLGVLPGILGGKVDAAKTDARATPGGDRLVPSFAVTGRMLKTFAFICLTWVFFRANTIGEAFNGLVAIPMDLFSIDAWRDVKVLLFQDDGITIVAMMLAFVSAEWVSRRFDHPLQSLILRPMIIRWAVYLILVILAMLFFPMQPSEFIYFQF